MDCLAFEMVLQAERLYVFTLQPADWVGDTATRLADGHRCLGFTVAAPSSVTLIIIMLNIKP